MAEKKTNHLTTSQIVEVCDCPPEYNSSSCQDPSLGYFRYYNTSASATIIIQTVGEARQCECNGRSDICNVDTGHCKVRRTYVVIFSACYLCGRYNMILNFRTVLITPVALIVKYALKDTTETRPLTVVNRAHAHQRRRIMLSLVKSISMENLYVVANKDTKEACVISKNYSCS